MIKFAPKRLVGSLLCATAIALVWTVPSIAAGDEPAAVSEEVTRDVGEETESRDGPSADSEAEARPDRREREDESERSADAPESPRPSRRAEPGSMSKAAAREAAKRALFSDPDKEKDKPNPLLDKRGPDYYDRRAKELLEADSSRGNVELHPLMQAHPDAFVVVCTAGCPTNTGATIVSMLPKPAPEPAAAPAPAADPTALSCVAGCGDRGPVAIAAAPASPAVAATVGEWMTTVAKVPADAATPAPKAAGSGDWMTKINEDRATAKSPAAAPAPVEPAKSAPKPEAEVKAPAAPAATLPAAKPVTPPPPVAVETKPAVPAPAKTIAAEAVKPAAPVETKPAPVAEAKPAVVETKPAVSKPAESKPVEAKPVESKPVEAKPLEAKPLEPKPLEPKQVESKPPVTVAEAKPADVVVAKPAPAPEPKPKPSAPVVAAAPAPAPAKPAEPAPEPKKMAALETPKAAPETLKPAAAPQPAPAAAATAKPADAPAAPAQPETKVAAAAAPVVDKPPAVVPPKAKDGVISVLSEDKDMNAAIGKARGSLTDFWKSYASPAAGETDHALKVAIAGNGTTEHFWLTRIKREGGKLSGVISNQPQSVTSVKMGERYVFSEDMISDWTFKRNGKLVGNETMRVLLPRMPAEQAAVYRKMYETP